MSESETSGEFVLVSTQTICLVCNLDTQPGEQARHRPACRRMRAELQKVKAELAARRERDVLEMCRDEGMPRSPAQDERMRELDAELDPADLAMARSKIEAEKTGL